MKRFDYESEKFELMHTGKGVYKKGLFLYNARALVDQLRRETKAQKRASCTLVISKCSLFIVKLMSLSYDPTPVRQECLKSTNSFIFGVYYWYKIQPAVK